MSWCVRKCQVRSGCIGECRAPSGCVGKCQVPSCPAASGYRVEPAAAEVAAGLSRGVRKCHDLSCSGFRCSLQPHPSFRPERPPVREVACPERSRRGGISSPASGICMSAIESRFLRALRSVGMTTGVATGRDDRRGDGPCHEMSCSDTICHAPAHPLSRRAALGFVNLMFWTRISSLRPRFRPGRRFRSKRARIAGSGNYSLDARHIRPNLT